MAGYVGHLALGETLDATPYFEGPWAQFERRRVEPGATTTFVAQQDEYAIIVSAGTGEYAVGEKSGSATEGSSFTVGYGAAVALTAGDEGLELFITTLSVPAL